MAKLIEDRKWSLGAPPHVGWWNASSIKSKIMWRWWDGTRWSITALPSDSPAQVVFIAKQVAFAQTGIYWSDFYPAKARVARVAPGK